MTTPMITDPKALTEEAEVEAGEETKGNSAAEDLQTMVLIMAKALSPAAIKEEVEDLDQDRVEVTGAAAVDMEVAVPAVPTALKTLGALTMDPVQLGQEVKELLPEVRMM